jgi:hypothetical protein
MLRGKRRRALDDMFAFTCVFGGDIAPLELATARPGTRWHARPGVYLLLLWIALTVGFRINLGKQTDLSGAPTPADFHVIAAVGPQDQREVKWLSLNELGSMGYIDENLSLALPPGPGQVLHEGGWDDLHYEVHALPDGSQRVEALLTKEWANERVVYRLENGKVLAEQFALIYPGAWAIALFGSTPLVFTLYFVWSLLMWIGKATKKSADPAQR